jgi:hypothetical protein
LWSSRQACHRWYSENTVLVEVYAQRLHTTHLVETEEYEAGE